MRGTDAPLSDMQTGLHPGEAQTRATPGASGRQATIAKEGARGRLLVTGFRPGAGGIGRDMVNTINGCAQAGADVHVLLETDDNPDSAFLDPAVRIHVVEMGEGRAAVGRMRDFIAQLAPQAVLSNRDRANGLVVQAASGLTPRPRVVVRVGINIPAKLRRRNPLSRMLRRRSLTATYCGADLLVGVSEGVCDGLRKLLGDKAPPIRRVYSPMDLAGIKSLAAQDPIHPWFRERSFPLLVSVGRLVRMKDQGTMLRAFTRLPRDFRLVIFGEGKQRPKLLALARRLGVEDRVDLPGHSENPFAHVARADLFVLSSRFEGFCNALLEAFVVGTPAVSTDCPSGPREILDNGRYGPLVPIGRPAELASAILGAISNPPSRALLEEAVARMDMEHSITYYLDALGLLGTTAGSGRPEPGAANNGS
ncbi:MAG: glycosyltransferase [Pseudomonadota bacterium]|nr:glycosyltransferase [Pseudomonadota bacterium]